MRKWYAIQASAADASVADISIHDEIGAWGIMAKDFIADLNKIDAKTINLSINSPGGSVFDGLAIYNALRSKAAAGASVNAKVLGVAASIASVILMAADKREMPSNAMVMVHNPWTVAAGTADDMRDTADVLDKIGASLVGVYTSRAGMSEDDVKALLSKDTWLSADEAKAKGFATDVTDPVSASASYDLERLPENVRALFKASAPPAPAPVPTPAAEPAFADQVAAEAQTAGFDAYAATWALAFTKIDEVKAAIGQAREVRALCAVAKRPDDADQFIKGRTPLADVRAALCKALAEADEHIDTAPRNKPNQAPANASPAAVTTAGIWAARRSKQQES